MTFVLSRVLSLTLQAVELWQKQRHQKHVESNSDSETDNLIASSAISESTVPDTLPAHPHYEIRLTRKFEPTELCDIFLTKWGKAAYIIVVTISCFLDCWSFTTVAGSAWATNIPFSTSTLQRCDSDEFLHVLIPSRDSCRNAYMLCVFFFAVITVPLSLLDLKEQAVLQMILGLLRFATIGGIILYTIVKLGEGGDVCRYSINETTFIPLNNISSEYSNTSRGFGDLSKIIFHFDAVGWLVSIPVFTYAVMLHQGIPGLTHPIREKHLLRQFMAAIFGIATISYLSLGVVVPLWFKATIQETCTLNWVSDK